MTFSALFPSIVTLQTCNFFPDPYVRVTFVSKSQETKILPQTLCPTWDQTLIFEDEDIYGNPGDLAKNPPSVVMELFDQDKV